MALYLARSKSQFLTGWHPNGNLCFTPPFTIFSLTTMVTILCLSLPFKKILYLYFHPLRLVRLSQACHLWLCCLRSFFFISVSTNPVLWSTPHSISVESDFLLVNLGIDFKMTLCTDIAFASRTEFVKNLPNPFRDGAMYLGITQGCKILYVLA